MKTKLTLLRLGAAVIAGALLPLAAAGAADETEPLELEFPDPQFAGTPVPAGGIKNLEKPGAPVKSIPVIKGSTNVAEEKPVTSSDSAPVIGEISYVTDADKEGSDGSFVELGPGPQWVQIDLGDTYKISAVVVWHYHKQARVYKDVVVQVAASEDMSNAKIIYNNDDDNSLKLGAGKDPAYIETNHGRIMAAKGVEGRYVRLWSNGSHVDDLNHYVEVEVWGVPAK